MGHSGLVQPDTISVTPAEPHIMIILGKIALVLYLIGWTLGGAYLLLKFGMLFKPEEGPGHDTAGSKSLSGAHFGSMWFGGFALGLYFLFK